MLRAGAEPGEHEASDAEQEGRDGVLDVDSRDAGFMAEEYRVDLPDAWQQAQTSIQSKVESACAGEVPGDTQRSLNVATLFSQETFKHVLLPVWIAAYLYQNRTYRFIVNGQTGAVSGEAPISWWKVAGVALVVAAIVLVIIFLTHGRG